MAGSFVGGFVGGTGNSLYSGAGFGQALAFGFVSGAFAAATSAVIYGGVKIAGKAIESAQNASRARAVASGVKTPIGQQGQGSAASSLNTNKGKSAIRSQALSLRSSDSEAEVIHVIKPRAEMQPIKTGDKVYRVWGDGAGPDGRSWTNINPESVPNFRAEAGLPPQNTGRFVTEGRLKDTTGVVTKPAESLYGNPGGLQEVFIPDPKNQVQIERVSGVNPEY
jgi:hypothetical protein